ncbi:heparan-alpha-glucosaminide N-acetyltransferase [Jannaschia faecimaris]|uniref:heparan-alpha-glucosaminide N-acetyltransferase n=1 Tax=Jannaschia faecimaris TaxID=1244108 RepID=UPI00147DA7D2|nr:heparan-alpha-glucosaminide N-acetyltransferase [Jannaschia faecimaris]
MDWLRTLALVNMMAFHFLFDLRMLNLLPVWISLGPWFAIWAKAIAGSFLFLAGFSLWLGHGTGFRTRSFIKRLGVLVLAAVGVSLVTYFAVPGAWVRFGILHSIALASVVGAIFLRAHWAVTLVAAAIAFQLLPNMRDPMFDGVFWVWTGLSTSLPPMIDYEPLVPWVAPFLLGMTFGQVGGARLMAWGPVHSGRWARRMAWPGQHTLSLYLIHQPLLIGLIIATQWAFSRIV